MNRRNFLKAALGGVFVSSLPRISYGNLNDIKILHSKVVDNYYGTSVRIASNRFRVNFQDVFGIIGVENGKPFKDFPSGMTEKNRWGFMGLGQQNDLSVKASFKQAKIIKEARRNNGVSFESILLYLENSEGLLKESIKYPTFNDKNMGTVFSAIFQIESMCSYLHHCNSLFGYKHPDLGVLAYNIGPSRVVGVFEDYFLNKGVPKNQIQEAKKGKFREFRTSVAGLNQINPDQKYLNRKYLENRILEPSTYLSEVKRVGKNFI